MTRRSDSHPFLIALLALALTACDASGPSSDAGSEAAEQSSSSNESSTTSNAGADESADTGSKSESKLDADATDSSESGSDAGTVELDGSDATSEQESTGGDSGGECPSDPDDGACMACLRGLCCEEVAACEADPACACVMACLNEGGELIDCAATDACIADLLEPPLSDLFACHAACEDDGCARAPALASALLP